MNEEGLLEQKPNFRDVLEMVRGGFFLRKKPLDGSSSPYTNSAFALSRGASSAVRFAAAKALELGELNCPGMAGECVHNVSVTPPVVGTPILSEYACANVVAAILMGDALVELLIGKCHGA